MDSIAPAAGFAAPVPNPQTSIGNPRSTTAMLRATLVASDGDLKVAVELLCRCGAFYAKNAQHVLEGRIYDLKRRGQTGDGTWSMDKTGCVTLGIAADASAGFLVTEPPRWYPGMVWPPRDSRRAKVPA